MNHCYQNIISVKNLCEAWCEFIRGKKLKKDVAEFSLNLSQNIFQLHKDLQTRDYQHRAYEEFLINDPKPRIVHKATVRDRLLHHAIYRSLYPFFDHKFIYDSYSCRYLKGTHRALRRLKQFALKVSKSNNRSCWVLKCDVRKFFASIDQARLIQIVKRHIVDPDTVWLIESVVGSFQSTGPGKGLPLGNLTSQLLVNVYMNEFDQFIKHELKVKHYVRYADDFVILSQDKQQLESLLPKIADFLKANFQLQLHPDKIFLRTFASGVDFLGWVNFPDHRVLRTATKRRMFRRLKDGCAKPETIQSYLGMLKHGNTYKLRKLITSSSLC